MTMTSATLAARPAPTTAETGSTAPAAPIKAKRGARGRYGLTDAQRAEIVTLSLAQPSLTRFAHSRGIMLSTLSSWRAAARDGILPVSAETRAALEIDMPPRSFTRRQATFSKGLDASRAAELVLLAARQKISNETLATRFGVSTSHVYQLLTRARDGLLLIPAADRDALTRSMRSHSMDRRKRRAAKTAPVTKAEASAAPVAAPKTVAQSAPAAKVKALPDPHTVLRAGLAASAPVVIMHGEIRIEVPSSLPAERIAAIVEAVAAA